MNFVQKLIGSFATRMGAVTTLPPPSDDWWYGRTSYAGITGLRVDENTAMQTTAVWACVKIIADTVSNLPLMMYRRTEGGKERAPEHPLYSVLHDRANAEQPAKEFWNQMIQHSLRYGNAYARIRYTARRDVESLRVIHPCRIELKRDDETDVKYYVYRPSRGPAQVLMDDDVLHLPYPVMDEDGLGGLSPIQAHARQVELGLTADEFRLRFLANDARPSMSVKFPAGVSLNEEKAREVRQALQTVYSGIENAGKIALIPHGGELVPLQSGMSKDLEFVQQMKYDTEQIARIYGVPLHLIQNLDRATFSNIEHQGIEAVTYTFMPWCNRIEGRVQHHLLGPTEGQRFFAEFNITALLRGDSTARATYYTSMRNSGIMTGNEIRSLENLNPIEGGDELMIQGAMVPISMAGQQQQAVTK